MALRGFQEKKMIRKVVFSAPAALILWAIILWIAWSAFSLWGVKIKLTQRNGDIQKEIEKAEESIKTIESKMESMRSEYGIDFEARSKFNLTKPGERVAIFADEKSADTPPREGESFLALLAGWIKNIFNFQQDGK